MIEALQFGNAVTNLTLAAATSGTLSIPARSDGDQPRWLYVATSGSPTIRVRPFTGAAPVDGALVLIPNAAPQIIYTGGAASLRIRNDDAALVGVVSILALDNQ